MARKTNAVFDDHQDFKAMILSPIVQWETEAIAAIENGTNAIMDSFRMTREAIQKSTDSVKSDIAQDRKTKKT